MNRKVDLFDSTYSHFETDVLARIRQKRFGEDFGPNSWTTAQEYRHWAEWLDLDESSHVLEVASGSGGPAIFLAELCGGRVTGIDINAHGVAAHEGSNFTECWPQGRATVSTSGTMQNHYRTERGSAGS